jgi:hypothetical protein
VGRTSSLIFVTAVLVSATLSAPSLAAGRTLVAEGSYVVQKADGTEPYDSWKLWKESDESFSAEVVSGSARIAGRLVQTFKFDQQFVPSGYALNLVPVRQGKEVSVSCRVEHQELSCDTEFEGKKSSTSTKVKGPCLVVVDDFPGLDFPWFSVASLRISDTNKHLGTVDEYVLKEKSLGQMSLELDDSRADQFVFAGEEKAEALGKSYTVRKYELDADEVWVVRVLPSGLVASMGVKGVPGSGLELTEYKEYATWAPQGRN